MKKTIIVKMNELNSGDLFSFRTIRQPIYWRFIKYRNDELIYEGIRDNKYQFKSPIRTQNVLVKSKSE